MTIIQSSSNVQKEPSPPTATLIERLLKQLSRKSSVAINSLPSGHKSAWVVEHGDISDTEVVGIFTSQKKADLYADELLERYPGSLVDTWEIYLNEKNK